MKYALKFTAMAAAIGLASSAFATDFVEGRDYQKVTNPENIAGDVIVVREFFWYGCPHCYNLEPYMQKWAKMRTKDVAFFRTPAAMNPAWEVSARGFYAAQQMGLENKTHQALFDAIHKEGKRNIIANQNNLADWYASQGADKAKFNSFYNSFSISTKIERAKQGAARYQLTGVPSIVVHGTYVVSGEDEKVTQIVDYLVDKIRKEKK